MPRYVIERQYLVPVYEQILVEAATFEDACLKALDDMEEPWGDEAKTDYESAGPTTIERAVELPTTMRSADIPSLSHLLYSAGLEPISIPPERQSADAGLDGAIGFV